MVVGGEVLYPSDEGRFAQLHFGGCEVGDLRRARRVVAYAEVAARRPGESIPAQCGDRSAAYNAVYDLFKCEDATPEGLQAAHTGLVLAEMAGRKGRTVLVIDDGSDMSWAGSLPIEGLGQVSNGTDRGKQGFHVHTSLAVVWPKEDPGTGRRPPVEILGLAAQQFYVRPFREDTGKKKKVRGGPEGKLWQKAGEAIGPAPENVELIRVGDRGADIFEFMVSCDSLRHDFVVRACQNRRLAGEEKKYLFETARAAAPFEGQIELFLRSRPGQAERTARLCVAATPVVLDVPQRLARKRGPAPLAVTAVRVFEPAPPPGVTPLEWVLLCRKTAETFGQTVEAVRMYATRWLIEEYHKSLKSGAKVEQLQLEHGDRLIRAAAILGIVALRLLVLRELARSSPDENVRLTGLDDDEITVLEALTEREVTTCREAVRAIASLGGFTGRKGDGEPGWKTLHIGYQYLQTAVAGYRIALQHKAETTQPCTDG